MKLAAIYAFSKKPGQENGLERHSENQVGCAFQAADDQREILDHRWLPSSGPMHASRKRVGQGLLLFWRRPHRAAGSLSCSLQRQPQEVDFLASNSMN